MFDILESDIVVIQEAKIQRKDLRDDMVLVPGWDCYFSLPRFKKGMLHPCFFFLDHGQLGLIVFRLFRSCDLHT